MNNFTDTDLRGSGFQRVNLTGSIFERADLSEAQFRSCNFAGSVFRGVEMRDVRITGAELVNMEIDAYLVNVVVNCVEIGPLIAAELDRRDPDRARMRPADPVEFRNAWDIVERRWDETVAHARQLAPALLHESVNDEWSFIETLRHLVFAMDAWIRRAILGDPSRGTRWICPGTGCPTPQASLVTGPPAHHWRKC